MKRLFAMLLALCMMCGAVCAAAESTTQTIEFRYMFDVPAEWTVVETGVFGDGPMEYTRVKFDLPDNSFREFEYESVDGSFGIISSYILWSVDVAVNHMNGGNWIDAASGFRNVKEAYEYEKSIAGEYEYSERWLPDGTRVACGTAETQVEYLLCKGSMEASVLVDFEMPMLERDADIIADMIHEEIFTEIVLPIFDSIRTPDGEQAVTPPALVEATDGKRSIRLGKATFEVDAGLVVPQQNDTVFVGENDRYTMNLMFVDWNAIGVDINMTGDEQMDNAFYCSLLVFGDQDAAATIAAQSLHADCNMPDGSDVMIVLTDGFLMLTHYYKETGFLLLLESKDEEYKSKLMEVAAAVAVSFRIDGVSDEEMAADAEAARVAAEEAAAKAAAQKYIVIKNSTANIRSGPSSDYDRITTAYKGDTFPLLGEEGTWYKIEVNGQTAYVSKGLCEISE